MSTPFQIAHDEMKALGLLLRQSPGQYRVNFPRGTAATEYISDDLQDALNHGRGMGVAKTAATDGDSGVRYAAHQTLGVIVERHRQP